MLDDDVAHPPKIRLMVVIAKILFCMVLCTAFVFREVVIGCRAVCFFISLLGAITSLSGAKCVQGLHHTIYRHKDAAGVRA